MARRRPPAATSTGPDDLGAALLAIRTAAGLTQHEVAERMGGTASEAGVSRAENRGQGGKRPTWEWICRFTSACGADAEIVFRSRK